MPREDTMGGCRPEPSFFVAPSRQARGPSALAHLGRTFRDAVPDEVRDARLALGRTKKDARQDKVGGTFLNSLPLPYVITNGNVTYNSQFGMSHLWSFSLI
jgi:hypothetical protein